MGTIVIDEQFDSWRIMLKNELSSKRYMHSIGVCNTSACLAMRYGYDIKKAYAAGLLHDCAKGLSEKKMLQLTERSGIELSEIERENPELLHAKAGSVVAAEKYEVNDTEILDAIRFHTTGRPSMTIRGSLEALKDAPPRIRIWAPSPGAPDAVLTFTPAILPWIISWAEVIRPWFFSSGFIATTEPVRSVLRATP